MRPRRYGSRRRAVEERVDPLDTFGGLLADIAAEMSPVVNMYRAGLFEDEYPTTPFATPRDRLLSLLEEPEYQRYVDNIASAGMGATTKVAKSLPSPRNKAETIARDVLKMRTAGKADEVTDEMLAAADPQYLFENTPLPMDEASRMARAKEMGFDTDAYHSTDTDIRAVDNDRLIGGQFWSTDDVSAINRGEVGAAGRGVVLPLQIRQQNPAGWNQYDQLGIDEMIGRGYDSILLSESDGTNTFVTFDPQQVRSRFARFDPEFRHLANLSAGVGGLGILSLLEPEQEVP